MDERGFKKSPIQQTKGKKMSHLRIAGKHQQSTKKHKPIFEYAREIQADWKNVKNNYAWAYLEPMLSIDQIEDTYGLDSATSVVLYFLSNANGWRGDTARRIKKELNEIVKNADKALVEKNHLAAYER